MNELIDALRFCADWNCSEKCPRGKADKDNPCYFYCKDGRGQKGLLYDAADAIEALQKDNEYCNDLLYIAIRATGISMTALVKLYEIEKGEQNGRTAETD